MEEKLDPHKIELKYKSTIKSIERAELSKYNKRLILKFKDDCIREGLSKARIMKLLETIKNIVFIVEKDLDKVNKKDIERFITIIQERNYSPWTKQAYKIILKKFFKWFKGNNEFYPEEVKWIKTNINKSQIKLPTEEGLITEDDIKLLIKNAQHPRDKAFISVLYESGCRIGELLTLRIKNVSFDEHGVLINVNGKTGSRKVRLISSTSYLATWLQNHPFNENKDSPLWINYGQRNYQEAMVYSTAKKLLRTLFKKSKIDKKFNPHLFRHSRATFLANHLTEFQMNQYFGWVQGSNMPATYVHLSGRETDSALFALNGIHTNKEKKESTLSPIKCPRCDNINSYDAKFCSKCAGILDIQTAMQLEDKRQKELESRKETDDIMNKLVRDPEIQKILIEKMATMGLK
ncbi:MAG: site-specific integrase [Nanoarchaeota archaeon]